MVVVGLVRVTYMCYVCFGFWVVGCLMVVAYLIVLFWLFLSLVVGFCCVGLVVVGLFGDCCLCWWLVTGCLRLIACGLV